MARELEARRVDADVAAKREQKLLLSWCGAAQVRYVLGVWLQKTAERTEVLRVRKERYDASTYVQRRLRHHLLDRLGPDNIDRGAITLGENREVRRLRVR